MRFGTSFLVSLGFVVSSVVACSSSSNPVAKGDSGSTTDSGKAGDAGKSGDTGGGGGGGGGSNTLTGTVSGVTFSVGSALATHAPITSTACSSGGPGADGGCTTTSSGDEVAILLVNRAGLACSLLEEQSVNFASIDALILVVATKTGKLSTGTFKIATSNTATEGAIAELSTTTATCGQGMQDKATSGTVTLTTLSATQVAGSYDVTFGTTGSFKGTFDTSPCALPDGGNHGASGDAGCTK